MILPLTYFTILPRLGNLMVVLLILAERSNWDSLERDGVEEVGQVDGRDDRNLEHYKYQATASRWSVVQQVVH